MKSFLPSDRLSKVIGLGAGGCLVVLLCTFPQTTEFLADQDRIPADSMAAQVLSYIYRPLVAVIDSRPLVWVVSRDLRHTVYYIIDRPTKNRMRRSAG